LAYCLFTLTCWQDWKSPNRLIGPFGLLIIMYGLPRLTRLKILGVFEARTDRPISVSKEIPVYTTNRDPDGRWVISPPETPTLTLGIQIVDDHVSGTDN
jgi:hypothetical protein